MATVSDYRLTFVWTRPVLDHLIHRDTSPPPFAAAVDESKYRLWFDGLPKAREIAAPAPPWPPHGGENFWSRYLNQPLENVTGAVAWRKVVPIRIPSPVTVSHDVAQTRVQTEGLVHPWGVTLILTVVSRKPWADLSSVATTVIRDRYAKCYRESGGPELNLDTVAKIGLARLRKTAFGPAAGSAGLTKPFSIFSVVRGAATGAEADPRSEPVQRLLQAAAGFSLTWESNCPNAYATDAGGLREHPPAHVVMAVPRGRALWAPQHFVTKLKRHTLACRHRNLVYASAQVDSICAFSEATIESVDTNVLGAIHRATASRAMPALGGLYLGASSTFKSRSLSRQITDRDALGPVNTLRDKLGIEPLT